LPENPIVKYYNDANGYCLCTLDRHAWRTDFLDVDSADIQSSPVRRRSSWVVDSGRAGAVPA
jgi:phosphodiesterase/alkaline phosphatase D-like protein